jgi:DNA segregation ATPase FtsK/SpoIIIE-like protein
LQRVAQAAASQGREGTVTVSLLQRRLRIGQSRAALLLDELVDQGYVGPASGSAKARPIIVEALPNTEPLTETPPA